MKRLLSLVFGLAFCGMVSAQSAMEVGKSYLVADFTHDEFGKMLEICHKGGFEYLLQRNPFSTYGHYQWNKDFASSDKSVARMAQQAEAEGIHLGLLVQSDAISTNDAYFAPKYHKHCLREGAVVLFDEISADERDMAIRRNDLFVNPSTLNLILVDKELISFGTMEFSGDIIILHKCIRGAYGTKNVPHGIRADAYKIWDSPDRFVAPDDYLRDSVRMHLNNRIEASGVAFVRYADAPGQQVLDEAIRVRQAERWNNDPELLKGGSLGWFRIHAADKKHIGTSMVDVEWMMSKAVGFDAGYGLVIDRKAMKEHGGLDDMLEKIRQWDELRYAGAFSDAQKQAMKDPYLDWHLVRQDDGDYVLYPMNLSRRHKCSFEEVEPGVLQSERWEWNAEEECRFGLRLQVDGKVEIKNPMVNTEKGLVLFGCTIKPGQRLVYDFEDVAYVIDASYNKLEEIVPEGVSILPEGTSEVYLICEVDPETKLLPEVTVRYVTREQPMRIEH